MFRVKYLVNESEATGLVGHRTSISGDSFLYCCSKAQNGMFWHTTANTYNSVLAAAKQCLKIANSRQAHVVYED